MKVIDFHAHIFPEKIAEKASGFIGEYYGYPMEGVGMADELLESAREHNVVKIVVHSSATKPEQVINVNNFVAEMTRVHDEFVGFGTVHPDFEDIEGEIDRIIKLGLCGIKLHPVFQGFAIDDPKAMKIYECIEGRLPLLIHVGDERNDFSTPRRLANILDKFKNLTVIAAHLGGYNEWEDAEKYLVGRNLYLDSSSSVRFLPTERARDLIYKHGIDKILFGTDFPLTKHTDEFTYFNKLELNDEDREKILFKNAAKLLGV